MMDRDPILEGTRWVAVAFGLEEAPRLQAFLEANPLYSQSFYGRPWPLDAAIQEIHDRPPPQWPQGATRHWAVLERYSGCWLGFLAFVEDLLAPQVWHLGFLVIATSEHGSGLASQVYAAWEAHAAGVGARWVRLGVVCANPRAGAFWAKHGFVEVRQRENVPYGALTQSMSVRVKALGDASLSEYLELVVRDRPESE